MTTETESGPAAATTSSTAAATATVSCPCRRLASCCYSWHVLLQDLVCQDHPLSMLACTAAQI